MVYLPGNNQIIQSLFKIKGFVDKLISVFACRVGLLARTNTGVYNMFMVRWFDFLFLH